MGSFFQTPVNQKLYGLGEPLDLGTGIDMGHMYIELVQPTLVHQNDCEEDLTLSDIWLQSMMILEYVMEG